MDIKTYFYFRNITFYKPSKYIYEEILHQQLNKAGQKRHTVLPFKFTAKRVDIVTGTSASYPRSRKKKKIYIYIYKYIYLLTYSMVQSPSWEANCFAASQEIPRIL